METKSDDKNNDIEMEETVDRYDNKIEEMNTIGLISALLFGFSITLWIEFDRTLFVNKNLLLPYIFTLSSMTTIISSALSTVIAICIVVSFRRLQFKFGKETNSESLRIFKRNTHRLRHFVRYFVNISYIALFIAIAVYSHVKWIDTVNSDFLFILYYILLVIGLIIMCTIYYTVKKAYKNALNIKQNS